MTLSSEEIFVRASVSNDHACWLEMRTALWPDASEADAKAWTATRDAVTLVAAASNGGKLVGFAEVGKRAYADGCDTSPVAFLEGWYVLPEMRRMGIGRKLVEASKVWAKQEGLHELASDALIANNAAHLSHLAAGFQEVERSIKYRLALDEHHVDEHHVQE